MSKKRMSAESSHEGTKRGEGSDSSSFPLPLRCISSLFQPGDQALKRGRLDLQIDTTLQDLPIELLENILVKAVAMEVESLKLAKSVWKEKADSVISRLGTVCSQWSSILTTNFFRKELHRTLDGIAQRTIGLEMLHQSALKLNEIVQVVTLKEDMFLIYPREEKILVYHRNNLTVPRGVIRLPGKYLIDIVPCRLSNCLFALCYEGGCYSLLRITKDEKRQFNTSPWLSDLRLACPTLSVSANGSLIILAYEINSNLPVVRIYDVNGSLQHEVMLPPFDRVKFRFYDRIIQKSDGNLISVSTTRNFRREVTEIDMNGTKLRQYRSKIPIVSEVNFVDRYGRIVLISWGGEVEILDSELNLLDSRFPWPAETRFYNPRVSYYDAERDEIVCVSHDGRRGCILTTFRLTD